MIRPYLAIIRDSFREAISSRILPLLLVLFTLALLALAPLGLSEDTAWQLRIGDIYDGGGLADQLRKEAQNEPGRPAAHIIAQLSPEFRERLTDEKSADETDRRPIRFRLRSELNDALEQPGFYNPAAWQDVDLRSETKSLIEDTENGAGGSDVARRNRRLLEDAYPQFIGRAPAAGVELTWFGNSIPGVSEALKTFTVERESVRKIVKSALAAFASYFVGKFGVLVAILVSANIIPRMFEAGSIDLLLSKPVSRSALFLTKFFSGCMFILIVSAYFILGLFLIVGMRFDVWDPGLLLSIPVFLFVFAIIYSVSAAAGVVWRNAIVSVLIAVMVWMFCMGLGTAKGIWDGMRNSQRTAAITPAGSELLITSKSSETRVWDESQAGWTPVFDAAGTTRPGPDFGFGYSLIGPVYDPTQERIIAIDSGFPSGMRFGSTQGKLLVARRADDWKRIPSVPTPAGIVELFVTDSGELLAGGPSGVFRFEGDPAVGHKPFKVMGFDVAPNKAGEFVPIGPEDTTGWTRPFAINRDDESGRLIVFSGGQQSLLIPGEDEENGLRFRAGPQHDLETEEAALVGIASDMVLVASADGAITLFDAESLEPIPDQAYRPHGERMPKRVVASPDGRWLGVLFHNRHLWLYSTADRRPVATSLTGQGDISAAHFSADGHLFTADRLTRITEYQPDSFEQIRQVEGETSTWEYVYRFVIVPLHTVLPKPGDLDYLITWLFTDEQSETIPENEENLAAEREVYDLWEPVWENLAFLVVMLTLTCVYIARRDF